MIKSHWFLCDLINLLISGIPAVSIPIKRSQNGMPLSLQIMGRNLGEPMILALAKFIESNVKFPQNSTIR